ncbi:transcriptional regulator NrdR [Collinsella sp. zg1085]|uniref:transcriptional regulator NrdR n=1 Tax=Collinsella sp. zg1085 TaxID=2844380 RepID=UPI001C0AA24E|nr:transcriptional regulator NrdR [Collinsella sp. zg1085]QWT17005.1 transcriptional regulator NrdR [Collinsella sp. zg1085]
MLCPRCSHENTRVIDSRMQASTNAIKRRRECRKCHTRFTTYERCEDPLEVVKSSGVRQPFDRTKLFAGIMHASSKRDIDVNQINALIDDIEQELKSHARTTVSSHEIGDMVLKRLETLDKVAYIRFASVYRDFKDIDEFLSELGKLR